MIGTIKIYRGKSTDPYHNLAVEQQLLETVPRGCCILYLWQNSNTVVIGYNQNGWKECRTALLEEEGGRLARRLSGGGAVFHDLGNLNFTFLMNTEDYDVDRQLSVIQRACRSFGIAAEKSGRNDVLADGRKFSGNAFYSHNGKSYHHGTLLVDVDMSRMGRYLVPSAAKLRAKGVESVRSRVVNLKELASDMTIEGLKDAMEQSFADVYGLVPEIITDDELDSARIAELTERNGSWDWNYGRQLPFDAELEEKFSWGEITIRLQVQGGVIQRAFVFTDSMDAGLADQVADGLTGRRLQEESLREGLTACGCGSAVTGDIVSLFAKQI